MMKSWMVIPTLALVSPPLHMVQKPEANLSTKNYWGTAGVNITQKGNFYKADYRFKLTRLNLVPTICKLGASIGRIWQ